MQDCAGFSEETKSWLRVFLDGSVNELPDIVINETENYALIRNDQLELYHALTKYEYIENGVYISDKPSLWTRNLETARRLGTKVISTFIANSSVLLDVRELDSDYVKNTLWASPIDEEVIIFPGTYRVVEI